MPRAKSAIEKVLEAWKSLQPAEKAAVMVMLKLETDGAKPKHKKAEKPAAAPLSVV